MPNWCSNIVLVKGDPDEVEKLLSFVEEDGNPFSLNKIIVMPTQLSGGSAPVRDEDVAANNLLLYGAKDWYDWAVKNWGTKWNTSDTRIVSDMSSPMMPGHRTVKITFNTAWSPPVLVYKQLAKLFPNTNIYASYDESGVGFSGWEYYKEGELQKQEEYDVSLASLLMYVEATEEVFEYVD